MTNPPADLRDFINAAGLGLISGTNLFAGSMRAQNNQIPTNAAFITGSPGPTPTRVMGESEEVRTVVVTVSLRWTNFGGGDTLIRSVGDEIQAANISGYLDVLLQDSEPVVLGVDDDGNHMFMISAEMTYLAVK